MVCGGHLERAWGSPRQRGCHGGIGSHFTHLPVTSRSPVLGAPTEAPIAAMAQQKAPGSSWPERTQVEEAQVSGQPRALCARGEPRGEHPRPATGTRIVTRHRPGKHYCWSHRRGQAGPVTRSTGFLSCQRSAGERQSWQTLCSDGLWRHLLRKPRRKRNSPGGLRRDFFRIAREPPACLIFLNTSRNSYQLLLPSDGSKVLAPGMIYIHARTHPTSCALAWGRRRRLQPLSDATT